MTRDLGANTGENTLYSHIPFNSAVSSSLQTLQKEHYQDISREAIQWGKQTKIIAGNCLVVLRVRDQN